MYYFILFYIRRAILTQKNPKKGLIEKNARQITNLLITKLRIYEIINYEIINDEFTKLLITNLRNY